MSPRQLRSSSKGTRASGALLEVGRDRETFILKVDPKNGGSSHLVFMTADIRRGGAIDTHRHPGADEILFLESGTARVHLGDTARVVHGGSTVFIPANTWISVDNIGNEAIRAVAVFSAPGFEEFMRETSARRGRKTSR
jgi:quercetin dioxygenase-like cupin family protein